MSVFTLSISLVSRGFASVIFPPNAPPPISRSLPRGLHFFGVTTPMSTAAKPDFGVIISDGSSLAVVLGELTLELFLWEISVCKFIFSMNRAYCTAKSKCQTFLLEK
jgi:hypothetical protein